MRAGRASTERLPSCQGSGKRVEPATVSSKDRERAKPPDKPRERLPPEQVALGWQQPQKVASPTSCTPPAPTPTKNAFDILEVEEMDPLQPARWPEGSLQPSTNRPKKKKERKQKSPAKTTREVDETPSKNEIPACAAQLLTRPHKSSYFLPGKAAGLTMLYLVDTGCNTNLISKRMFDRLPKHVQVH